ncbi:unnamed protein product [Urochloa decumbens]|uniref:MATH domain-containing protein n=1 Tax=Urochloa decumbens TaxID=240449 RepID=A0ABC8XD12_9POAL
MPPPASTAGDLDDDALSSSSIVGGTVTGHHLLHIDCYSRTKEDLPNGQYIDSCPFRAGGGGSIAEPVKARARFSLLDQAGEPVPLHSWTTRMHDFSKATSGFGYNKFLKRAWLEESKHLKDDRFTIRCDVIINKELRAEGEGRMPQLPLVAVPPSNLHQNLGDLLASEEGADVIFQAEVFGAMKESADAAVIRIDDMYAQVFRALLRFLYTDTLPEGLNVKGKEGAAMAEHLLVAADRYNLERLKLICEDKLCSHIDTDSVVTILALAEQHHCHGLKEACLSAGDHSWRIGYFPNGYRSSAAEFISIFLYLDEDVAQPVKARFRVSLLDQAGEFVSSHSHITKIHGFCTAARGYGFVDFIKRALLEKSEHLKDDCFTIRCDVTVTTELRAEKRRPASPLVVVPPSNLHRNFGDLLASEDGADVTFRVAGYEVQGAQDMEKHEDAAMAQHLLVAADRYNLERLKLICEDRLCSHIDTTSAASILALAEQHCPGLKEACFRFLSFPSALNAVMTTDGFDHLTRSCPCVLKELMSNIAARVPLISMKHSESRQLHFSSEATWLTIVTCHGLIRTI